MSQIGDALDVERIEPEKANAEVLAKQISSPKLIRQKQQFITSVLNKANVNPYWGFWLNTLEVEIRFDLLHRIVGNSQPLKEDWINLFRQTDYDFQTNVEYRAVLSIALTASVLAIAQIVYLPLVAIESELSWIGILPAVVVIDFWLFLWQGIDHRLEALIFKDFGILGISTFPIEINRLLKTDSVWVGINTFVAAIGNDSAVASAVAGAGIGFWARAAKKDDIGKYLAILSFPFFCWFPITLTYATLALLNFFTWPIATLIWSVVFAVGTWCWVTGQKRDRQARNPLQGILPDHYNPNYKG